MCPFLIFSKENNRQKVSKCGFGKHTEPLHFTRGKNLLINLAFVTATVKSEAVGLLDPS